MPTLFRFLMVLGVIAGVVSGSLYVLAEYFQPQPKEISKSLRRRCGPSRGFLAGLALVAAILCGWGPVVCGEALAQVERRQLPVLPGEAPSQPDQDFGVPPAPSPPDQDFGAQPPPPGDQDFSPAETPPGAPAENWSPNFQAPSPVIRQSAGGGQGESALPPDLWRGLDGSALQGLLGQVPMPSSSPALASLLARALAASSEGGSEMSARIAALESAGRVNELIDMLGQGNEPGALAPYALALLAAGRTEDACAVQLEAGGEAAGGLAKRATFLIPAYCAALSGDHGAARQALDVARDNGVDVTFAARAIGGQAQRPALPSRADVLDYLFLKLGQGSARADLAARATPELLFLLAHDDEAPAELRLAAAERAASLNVVGGETLASVYADAAAKLPKSAQSPGALRAKLFAALGVSDLGKDPRRVDRCAARKQQGCEDRDPHGAGAGESKRRICARHAERKLRRDRRARRGPCRRRSNCLG